MTVCQVKFSIIQAKKHILRASVGSSGITRKGYKIRWGAIKKYTRHPSAFHNMPYA